MTDDRSRRAGSTIEPIEPIEPWGGSAHFHCGSRDSFDRCGFAKGFKPKGQGLLP